MTVYLLDVNVLLALSDPIHVHHDAAHRFFAAAARHAWASCPITENGFVRIASHPRYPNRPGDVAAVLALLRQLCSLDGHQFWADDISVRDALLPGAIVTHAHITDTYLLALAAQRGGMLATLDQGIASSAVQDGQHALQLIAV